MGANYHDGQCPRRWLPRLTSGGARRSRSAFSVPNFRVYFASAAAAQTGSWLLRTAQAWLVLDLTGTPAALALVTILQALPVTILTLFAGILIDRMQSRRLLVYVQIVISLETAVMAVLVLTNTIQYWQVLVLATILGLASAVDFPTRSSIISELVEPRLVANGVALNSALNSAARIASDPGIGGLLIATWGSGVCFAVTAVVYAFTTLGLFVLKSSEFFLKRLARRQGERAHRRAAPMAMLRAPKPSAPVQREAARRAATPAPSCRRTCRRSLPAAC